MSSKREVLILANSSKIGGRCVAAIDLKSHEWLRPIGQSGTGELSVEQTKATWKQGLIEVAPLDVVAMTLGQPAAKSHHPEDILRTSTTWGGIREMTARAVIEEFGGMIELGPTLLGSRRDRLSLSEIGTIGAAHRSLTLVRPGEVTFSAATGFTGKTQIRAQFTLGQVGYDLSVTDSSLNPAKLPPASDYLLTISLGVPFLPHGAQEQCCYKIVAGVVPVV
jgi:hypothetical protein